MVTLVLTESQGALLDTIVEEYIIGIVEATKDTEQDRSLDTPEELLDAMDGMHQMFHEAGNIRDQLRRVSLS